MKIMTMMMRYIMGKVELKVTMEDETQKERSVYGGDSDMDKKTGG